MRFVFGVKERRQKKAKQSHRLDANYVLLNAGVVAGNRFYFHTVCRWITSRGVCQRGSKAAMQLSQ